MHQNMWQTQCEGTCKRVLQSLKLSVDQLAASAVILEQVRYW